MILIHTIYMCIYVSIFVYMHISLIYVTWFTINDALPRFLSQYDMKISKNTIIYSYNDVIIGAIASQITSLTIVYSTVYSGADQRKYQSSASLAFVRGIHRGPVNSPHKWPVTRKMSPFDDVIMDTLTCVNIDVLRIDLENCMSLSMMLENHIMIFQRHRQKHEIKIYVEKTSNNGRRRNSNSISFRPS